VLAEDGCQSDGGIGYAEKYEGLDQVSWSFACSDYGATLIIMVGVHIVVHKITPPKIVNSCKFLPLFRYSCFFC